MSVKLDSKVSYGEETLGKVPVQGWSCDSGRSELYDPKSWGSLYRCGCKLCIAQMNEAGSHRANSDLRGANAIPDWSASMRQSLFCASLIWAVVFVASGSSQSQQKMTLTVEGQNGHAPVIQSDGRAWVDIDALARLTNSSLSYSGNQIVLTLHMLPPSPPENQGLSKDFLNAGIEAMSEIREWRSALQSAIRYGFPPNDDWVTRYRDAAMKSVRLASVAASTDSDRKTSQLISNELDNMQKLSDKMLSARKNMTYIPPDALANDPLDMKIIRCAHSLAAIAASGQFQDDGSCH